MSPSETAIRAAATAAKAVQGVSGLYRRRTGESATLTVVPAKTDREQSSDRGFTSVVATDDVLVVVADFTTAFGADAKPDDGDQIERGGRAYAARPFGGEPCWRRSDPYGVRWRIHLEDEGEAV